MSLPTLEICVHCVGKFYPHLLSYQLTSLIGQDVTVSVISNEDMSKGSAFDVVNFFAADIPGLTWYGLKGNEAMRRAIGRNLIAKKTKANLVWFCDVDHLFFSPVEKIRKSIALTPKEATLLYPKIVFGTKTHQVGEDMIKRIDPPCIANSMKEDEFTPNRIRFAIGGLQIVRQSWCHEHGYLDGTKWQDVPNANEWQETRDDVAFRKSVPGPHMAIDIPGIYRIRHRRAKDWWTT